MDRSTDYMAIYKNISAGLKRRFRRKPNLTESSEQFSSLSKTFQQQDCPSYAAFCSLAQARCEHGLGNHCGEIQLLLDAARSFIIAERQSFDFKSPSYNENLTSAINCYEHAIKLCGEIGEPALAACYCQELAATLMDFNKPSEARIHFQRAAELNFQNPIECLKNMKQVALCKVEERDLEGALTILTEMQYLAQERGGLVNSDRPLGIYSDTIIHCEVMRVLLLMLLRPTPQRIRPEHAQTLEKYAWSQSSEERNLIIDLLDEDLFILLQSLVMSCQSSDVDELRQIQSQLMTYLDKTQNHLVQQIVTEYSNR